MAEREGDKTVKDSRRVKALRFKGRYNLVCIAPDGEHIIDVMDKTYDECVKRSHDMGSRWYFYHFHVITTLSNKTVADVGINDMKMFIGKRLTTLKAAIAAGEFNYCLEI
jgi:heterodisulfide reductase subunit B